MAAGDQDYTKGMPVGYAWKLDAIEKRLDALEEGLRIRNQASELNGKNIFERLDALEVWRKSYIEIQVRTAERLAKLEKYKPLPEDDWVAHALKRLDALEKKIDVVADDQEGYTHKGGNAAYWCARTERVQYEAYRADKLTIAERERAEKAELAAHAFELRSREQEERAEKAEAKVTECQKYYIEARELKAEVERLKAEAKSWQDTYHESVAEDKETIERLRKLCGDAADWFEEYDAPTVTSTYAKLRMKLRAAAEGE